VPEPGRGQQESVEDARRQPSLPGRGLTYPPGDFPQPTPNGYPYRLPVGNASQPYPENPYHSHPPASPERRRPQNPDPGSGPSPNRFNARRIRGGTTYRGDELDQRKCLVLVEDSQADQNCRLHRTYRQSHGNLLRPWSCTIQSPYPISPHQDPLKLIHFPPRYSQCSGMKTPETAARSSAKPLTVPAPITKTSLPRRGGWSW
jgi:hypothetical protein